MFDAAAVVVDVAQLFASAFVMLLFSPHIIWLVELIS